MEGAQQTLAALDDDEDALQPRLTAATQRIAVSEAISDLRSYLARLDLDPLRLAQVEDRMGTAFDLAHQLRVEPSALTVLRDDLHQRLREIGEAAYLETLRRQCQQAEAAFRQSAVQLGGARKKGRQGPRQARLRCHAAIGHARR